MATIFNQPESIQGASVAKGVASDGALWRASVDAMRLLDNTNSNAVALEESYDDWIDRIYSATGNQLQNPMVVRQGTNQRGFFDLQDMFSLPSFDAMSPGQRDGIARQRQEFVDQVENLAKSHADGLASDWALFDPDVDAARRAGASEEHLAKLNASRSDIFKHVVGFGGAMQGALSDPFQVATLLVGGGAGAGKTAIARILSVATREAAINAGVEAAMQPMVQEWRAKAGVSAGFSEAMQNIAFAAGGGAILGAGFSALGEGFRATKGADGLSDGARVATDLDMPDEITAALNNDLDANVRTLTPIREALPPEARGALDAADAMDGEVRILDDLVEHTDNGVAQYDANRTLATQAANGDVDALARLVDRDGGFADFEPDFSPPPKNPFPEGLDNPHSKIELEAFTARFGDQFDEATMALPAMNEDGDIVSLADILDDASYSDNLSEIVTACRG